PAAIAIFLAVGLVVLVGVGHKVVQGEAVVRGDEVHRRIRATAAMVEQVRGTGEARGKFGELAPIAAPERARGVAKSVVPLRPAGREATGLVAAQAKVPRLGNQL